MSKDDLDRFAADRTKKNPRFPDLIEAAEERRVLARQLAEARKKLRFLEPDRHGRGHGDLAFYRQSAGKRGRCAAFLLAEVAAVLGCELKVELVPKAS